MTFGNSLGDILEFGLKALIVVIAFALCVKLLRRVRNELSHDKRHLQIEDLKKKYEKYQDQFYEETLSKKDLKAYLLEKNKLSKKLSWKARLFSKKTSKSSKAFNTEINPSNSPDKQLSENQTSQNQTSQNQSSENQSSENQSSENQSSENQSSENQSSQNQSSQNQLSENQTSQNQTSQNPSTENNKTENTKPASSKKSPTLFVLSFEGDIKATEVSHLREEISILLNVAQPEDEVLLLLESPGGLVSHYGLASNQLQRIRDHKIPLTICVDRVAGSGGYLMACVANRILASPFALIGSIGVFSGVPNIHEFLKKHDVSYEEFTAGKFKRTVTPFSEITEEKKQQYQEQLNMVHIQFKNFVSKYRNLDMEKIGTGEVWLAEAALEKGLVDELKCSDDYILEKIKSHKVYKISLKKDKTTLEKWMDKRKDTSQILEQITKTDFFI